MKILRFLYSAIILPILFTLVVETVVFKINEFVNVPKYGFIVAGIISYIFILVFCFITRFINTSQRIHNFLTNHMMILYFLLFLVGLIFMCIQKEAHCSSEDLRFGITTVWTITGISAAIFAILLSRQKTFIDLIDLPVNEENKNIAKVKRELNEYKKESLHSFFISNVKGLGIIIAASAICNTFSTAMYFEPKANELLKENSVFVAITLAVLIFIFVLLTLALYYILKSSYEKNDSKYESDLYARKINVFILNHYRFGNHILVEYKDFFENIKDVNINSIYGNLSKNIKSFDESNDLYEKAQVTNSILLSLFNVVKAKKKSDKSFEEVYKYLKGIHMYLIESMFISKRQIKLNAVVNVL